MLNPFGNAGSRFQSVFRYDDGMRPNVLALSYAVAGYLSGLVLLAIGGWWFAMGVVLLAHSLVIAAYLLHECTHSTIFRAPRSGGGDYHQRLAVFLSWLTGACYGDPVQIRNKHLRHHFERADICALDYRIFLAGHPRLKRLIEFGQRCGLPAVELLMHALVVLTPFGVAGSAAGRWRVVMVAGVRTLFFVALGFAGGVSVLVGYGLAYLAFLTVLNFMDAFQHQYLLLEGLNGERGQSPTRDTSRFPVGYFSRDYENSHTWSNLISERWPALNLLVLNFPYHNIHHLQPAEPWYRLPRLHQQRIAEADKGVHTIPFSLQIRDFWRYRVHRVMAPATDDPWAVNPGAAGVSFLTPL
jgi:fatty acid desaturase